MSYDASAMQDRPAPPVRRIVPTGWHALLVPALLIVTAALAITSLVGDSPTFDEPLHLASGVAMLRHGDFRMSADHPPLARIWCALPLMFMSHTWPGTGDESWVDADIVPFAIKWMFELNEPQRLIIPARLMMVALLLATCVATYALARRLWGPDAGLLALVIATSSPTLLAHGRLVTTDLPIALFIALTLLSYAWLLERVTWPRLIAAGLAVGAASVSKMSWPLVLPAMAVMLIVALRRGSGTRSTSDGPQPSPLSGGNTGGSTPENASPPPRQDSTLPRPLPQTEGGQTPSPLQGGTTGGSTPERPGRSAHQTSTLPQPLPGREGCRTTLPRPLPGREGCRTTLPQPLPGREGGQRNPPPAPPQRGRETDPPKLLVASVALGAFVWLAIWSAYGWQRTLLAPLPHGATPDETARFEKSLETVNYLWHYALHDPDNVPRTGLVASLCRAAVDYSLLPDGYVFGLARTLFFTGARTAYFLGDYSETGWRAYFPVAFLIKTPIAAIALMFAGIAALWAARARTHDGVLLAGAAAFIVIYGGYLIASNVNLGHRHLLPLYPLLYAIAGGAAAWLGTRLGRWLITAAVVWLVGANLWIHPHYLSYFNELVGGPARGHEYLVDSSLDWGQDLVRLADFTRREQDPIHLAYFGSARPRRYLDCRPLPSFIDIGPTSELGPGVYVISATQLVGLYTEHIRASFWGERARQALRELERIAATPPPADAASDDFEARERAIAELPEWRAKLLIARLRDRHPDARVGWSMMVYRLSQPDIDALTRP